MFSRLKTPMSMLIVLWLCIGSALAQEIAMSQPMKFRYRTSEVNVLGKKAGQVYTHISEYRKHYVLAYDENMALKWKKGIAIDRKKNVLEHIAFGNRGLVVYFSEKRKNTRYLYARKYDWELNPTGESEMIDSFKRSFGERLPSFQFKESFKKDYTIIYLIDEELNRNDNFQYVVVDQDQKRMSANRMKLPTSEKRNYFEDILVTAEGHIYLIIGEYKDMAEIHADRYWILSEESQFQKNNQMVIDPGENIYLNNTKFKIDNTNNTLVASGFYAEDFRREASAEGVFTQSVNLETDSIAVQKRVTFPPEFISRIKGSKRTRRADRLFTFSIDDIILRNDGGAIIMAESFYQTYRSTRNMYDPYGFPTFNESNITYHFEEILIVSVDSAGSIQWKNILPKSQISSGDNGRYSSYSLINTGYNLVFIYNDQIINRTNVVQYIIEGNGHPLREVIFNSKIMDLYLLPRNARQVSASEMVIPSLRKNKLKFVKLSY